jgi:hypothetical protein
MNAIDTPQVAGSIVLARDNTTGLYAIGLDADAATDLADALDLLPGQAHDLAADYGMASDDAARLANTITTLRAALTRQLRGY